MKMNKLISQIEMLESLKTAIDDAGGSTRSNEQVLLNMTLYDMLDIFAQNNIRFVYKKPISSPVIPSKKCLHVNKYIPYSCSYYVCRDCGEDV